MKVPSTTQRLQTKALRKCKNFLHYEAIAHKKLYINALFPSVKVGMLNQRSVSGHFITQNGAYWVRVAIES
jgi:hypothetical protein